MTDSAGGKVNRNFNARTGQILRLANVAAAGVRVRDLVSLEVRAGRSQAVARASLSRTLRRLWRVGLVELHGRFGSLSAKQREARERMFRFEADPQSGYEGYRAWARAIGICDCYGSAEAFLAAKRAQANALPRLWVVRVAATTLGRELVEGLGRCAEVPTTGSRRRKHLMANRRGPG